MKKVGKYLTISLLLAIGLFFVGLLFLFFVPTSSLFGITFISYNETSLTEYYEISQVDKVVINSRSYKINIESTLNSKIYAKVENHSLGYVLKKNKDLTIGENLSNNILTLSIIEPYGAAFKNNSSITLYIPKNKEVDLSLQNKNASVIIDDENITIKNLSYSTEKGNLELKQATITGNLNLNLNKANFCVSSKISLISCDIDLKISTGKFDLSSSNIRNLNIIENDRGVILLNQCENLTQQNQVSGGRIEANAINNIYFYGTDTNLYINQILNGANIKTNSGTIKINTLSGTSDIITSSGDISIKTCTSRLTVLTKDGDVKINQAYNKTSITTESGDITLHFANDANFATSSNKEYRYLKAITKSGNVRATGLNSAIIEITKTGSVNVDFANFDANLQLISSIKTNKGSIYTKVNSFSAFVLNSSTNSGNSRINLAQTESHNGWTDKHISNKLINCSSLTENTNQISLNSSSGNILMHDDKVN